MTPHEKDAANCGRYARALAAFGFEVKDKQALRDHDTLLQHWRDRPGFMQGYAPEATGWDALRSGDMARIAEAFRP